MKFLSPIHYLWNAFSVDRSPKQIAWAIALGVLVGLIPKGNLTAGLAGMLLLALRVNLGVGMITAVAVTTLSSWTDPLTHGIGQRLLASPRIREGLDGLYQVPLAPWLTLHNTVVLGGAVLGLVMLYPTQHLAEMGVRYLCRRTKSKRSDSSLEPPAAPDPTPPPHLVALAGSGDSPTAKAREY